MTSGSICNENRNETPLTTSHGNGNTIKVTASIIGVKADTNFQQ